MRDLKLPCSVGDQIFIVRDYNECIHNSSNSAIIDTIYRRKLVIVKIEVEGFIIDKYGIHFAEETNDGWDILESYSNWNEKGYGNQKIFLTLDEAMKFIDPMRRKDV